MTKEFPLLEWEDRGTKEHIWHCMPGKIEEKCHIIHGAEKVRAKGEDWDLCVCKD